ncbi:hypothetical protein [Burkholderia pseudomallei]|uniref:hypothetical protein n=1 Tax=Burkholderia pseudomallei TaxID=28450 RepID=UPI001269F00B|nr:hypothetical protein [Burkholderia pseudomallei]MBM5589074.1 hypothetical protein [Burkholderia pseudomallei]
MGLTAKRKEAVVRILNNSSKDILAVGVGHKYSSDFKDKHYFSGPIKKGETTRETMDVSYNIGSLTTGKDWWLVTWVTSDGYGHITTPNNFRDIIDKFEVILDKILNPLAVIVASVVSAATTGGAAEPLAIAAATLVVSTIVEALINNEATAGYKQHILREEDGDNVITITDNGVTFHSKSGDSNTVFSSFAAEKDKDGKPVLKWG